MLPETGPELPQDESLDSAVDNDPEDQNIQFEASPGRKPPDKGRKKDGSEEGHDGEPAASREQLEDLRANGPGAQAEQPPDIKLGEATWKNKDTDQPITVLGYLGEKEGRHYISVGGSDAGVPLDEIEYPTEKAEEELPPMPAPEDASPPVESQPEGDEGAPSPPPPPEEPTEKVPEEPEGPQQAVEDLVGKAQGHIVTDQEVPANQSAFQEWASRIGTRLRGLLSGQRPELYDESTRQQVQNTFDQLGTEEGKVNSFTVGHHTYTILRRETEDVPPHRELFTLQDENGQTYHKDSFETQNMLAQAMADRYKGAAEQKTIQEESKQEDKVLSKEETRAEKERQKRARAHERFQEKPEKREESALDKKRAALKEGIEKTPVGRLLLNQGRAALDNINLSDKNLAAWLTGGAVGGVTTVLPTLLLPGSGIFASRFLRSLVGVGLSRVGSSIIDKFRLSNMRKIFRDRAGIEDESKVEILVKRSEEALKYKESGELDRYDATMNEVTRQSLLKKGQAENWATDLSRAAQISLLETLNTRFANYNNVLRSFTAGMRGISMITSLGSLGWDLFDATRGGGDAAHVHGPGEQHGPVGPGEEAAVPTETPTPEPVPVPEETPTPTPTPEPEPGDVVTPGEEVPTGVDQPPVAEAPTLSEVLANPEFAQSVEIPQGTTVGELLANSGHSIDWGPDNAQLFGAHIQANYDMLQEMHTNVAASGIPVEDFPTQAEIATLVTQAEAGDPVAMHQLTEALHWVPAGGNFNVLTPEGLEQARRILQPGG
ncbi:MAG: hypothetical protein WD187_00760 [Candidatus Woykebacteria bacterium]